MTHKLREILLVGFFMLTFLIFAAKGMWLGIYGVLALFAATLLLSPERCLIALFFCYFFQIAVPVDLLGWRLFYQWVLVFWVGVNIARLCLRRDWQERPVPVYLKRAKTCAYLFLAALASVMLTRGAGIYRFGGDLIGGSRYILVIITVLGLLFSFKLQPLEKNWKKLFIFFLIGPFFQFFIQLLVARGNYWLKTFVNVTAVGLQVQEEGVAGEIQQMGRYVSLTAVSTSFLGLASVFWFKKRTVFYFLCIAFALVSAGFSGYRRSMLSIAIILSLYHLFCSENKKKVFGLIVITGGVALVGAYLLAPYLPYNVQRTFAFLPGINIDFTAYQSATGTAEWRLELWRHCLDQIPQYLLIGKGALLSVAETIANRAELAAMGHRVDIIFRGHAYHSILLAFLLDLGALATLAYFGLIFYMGRHFFRLKKRLRGERHAVFCFLLAFWINVQIHQLYSTGLLFLIVSNLLYAILLLIVGSVDQSSRDNAVDGVNGELNFR